MTRLRSLIAPAALLALLAGCTVGPDYVKPEIATPPAFQNAPTAPATADPQAVAAWWGNLKDPALTSIIETALAANHDVRLAVARLDEARALLGVSRAARGPSVDANASADRSRSSETTPNGGRFKSDEDDTYTVGAGASWELDFFGRVRRSVEASQADLDAAEASVHDAQVLIAAEVARRYVDLRGAQKRLEVNQQAVKVRQESLDLSKALVRTGLSAELDVAQAEAEVASRQAAAPAFETLILQNAQALAVLCGKHASELLPLVNDPALIPAAPEALAVGAPAELLMRRPDLRRAERNLAAATARIGVATADLYPRFNLLGNFSLSAANPGDLYDLDSRGYSFGPSMTWSVFSNGRVRSNIDAADARTRQSLISYEKSVLVAVREVEDGLVAWSKERVRLSSLEKAVAADQRAVELAQSLLKSGLSSLTPVLDNQRRLYEAQDQSVQSQIAVTQNAILVYKAMGGGWTPPAPEHPAPETKPEPKPEPKPDSKP